MDEMQMSSLRDWLATKPPGEKFIYASFDSCMLAQYFTAKGYENVRVYSIGILTHGQPVRPPSTRLLHEDVAMGRQQARYPLAFDEVSKAWPPTFGRALEVVRLRA